MTATVINEHYYYYYYYCVPGGGKDLFEVSTGVDERGEAETQHGRVVGMQKQRPVNDVEKQRKVPSVCYRTRHTSEHVRHQLAVQQTCVIYAYNCKKNLAVYYAF